MYVVFNSQFNSAGWKQAVVLRTAHGISRRLRQVMAAIATFQSINHYDTALWLDGRETSAIKPGQTLHELVEFPEGEMPRQGRKFLHASPFERAGLQRRCVSQPSGGTAGGPARHAEPETMDYEHDQRRALGSWPFTQPRQVAVYSETIHVRAVGESRCCYMLTSHRAVS
jgi:hypothetical protein